MSPLLVVGLMFLCMLIFFVFGGQVAFVLGGVGAIFVLLMGGEKFLQLLPVNCFEKGTYFIYVAIPLFIFIGCILQVSGIADALYGMVYKWLGRLPGGLAIGTVLICVVFAAMVGIVGAATVTMGLIALPSMLKRGYKKDIAIGCISAGGALGFLIPPSVTMIVYASMANLSIGKMFMGGVFPGLLLASLFIIYILVRSFLQPSVAPQIPKEEAPSWRERFISLRSLIAPLILVTSIMGSIFLGLATPTEAAGAGAFVSIVIVATYRRLNWFVFKEAIYTSSKLTIMVLWIIIGVGSFSTVISTLGLTEILARGVELLGLNRWVVLIAMQISFFFLGMVMDDIPILMITIPIYIPLIELLGFDPLWFGVLFIINMQMAYLTPPFGFVLFYMRGVAPPGVSMGDIYRSIWPFVLLQTIGLVITMIFPQIILWLPSVMF